MVVVEMAETGHAEGICRVGTVSWRDAYSDVLAAEYVEANVRSRYDPERIAEQIADVDEVGEWLVALDRGGGGGANESVVGTVRDDRPEPGVGEVSGLYVHPDWQGEGVGSRLLSVLTERQRAAGATEQHTYVFAGNDPATGFYESKGFEADERFAAAAVDGVEPDAAAVRFVRSL